MASFYGAAAAATPLQSLAEFQAASRVTQLQELDAYITMHHNLIPGLPSWHTSLNNHASTRPKTHGGRLCTAVTACKTFTPPPAIGGKCSCTLELPNSFHADDGRVLRATGEGSKKEEASENACRHAFAQLLMANPSQVLLRPSHWDIPIQDLLDGLPGSAILPVHLRHQALPVHMSGLSADSGSLADTLSESEVNEQVADILRTCLLAAGGAFDPSQIRHGHAAYSLLNKLLLPGGLRPFVEQHPEFSWQQHGPKGMQITLSGGPLAATD